MPWLFAYGSLVFRPAFAYLERRRAFVRGWSRRFWQGSPDHRGVPEAPGRVATLVSTPGKECGGCAYRIDAELAEAILVELDARERAGFRRVIAPLFDAPGAAAPFAADALVYVADESNPHFLGPLPEAEIASWVLAARGPSGGNADYVLRLHASLVELQIEDDHVEAIAAALARSGAIVAP